MVDVGIMIARECDEFIKSECESYEGCLERLIRESKCCKGRLLHYYPKDDHENENEDDDPFSDWCGWHNDHGSLTSLLPPLYTNNNN